MAYELLLMLERGTDLPQAIDKLNTKHGHCDTQVYASILNDLKASGLFCSIPAWPPVSDQTFAPLWCHHPCRIQLMMAESCNLRCGYCYAWRNDCNDKRTLMAWRVARTAVDHLVWRSAGRPNLQVTFFGGEPLLNLKVIKQTVEYCKSIEEHGGRKFVFELITNGTLLTQEVTDYLIEHRFLLFISLDGWREMHNYNRPAVDGSDQHDTILQNAIYANQQYQAHGLPKVKLRANLTDRYTDVRKVASYFESHGFTYIGIGPIEPLPHGDNCGLALSEEQMEELMVAGTDQLVDALDALKQNKKVGPYVSRLLHKTVKAMTTRSTPGVVCGVCRNTAIVDNKGFVYPCHRYAGMDQYRMGSVFTGIEKRLVLDYYGKLASRAIADCQDCWIRDFCAGGCPWCLSDKHGNVHKPSKVSCDRRRTMAERGLWLRKELLAIRPAMFENDVRERIDDWCWPPESNSCR
ncbi:MAG: radical SAM protein [Thermoguttaceae bacterium]